MIYSRHIHRIAVLALVAGLTVALAAPGHARKKKTDVQIKFATLAPEGSSWMKVMHSSKYGARS